MTLKLTPESVPLRVNQDGVVLVGETRVRLEVVIAAFHQGDSPEQIVDNFDVLTLAEVYSVIAYYLHHRQEVDEYLHQQAQLAKEVRSTIETQQPSMLTLRQKLLSRKKQHA